MSRILSPAVSFLITASMLLPGATCVRGFAQQRPALPGCEAPAELQAALKAKLAPKLFENMKYSEALAKQMETIDQLIAKYPREAEPPRKMIDMVWGHGAVTLTVRDRFVKQAAAKPDDPLAQALAGYSLATTDPQQAIQKLDTAKSIAKDFSLPYLLLAEIYSVGKIADAKKLSENITGYFNLCPTSTDTEAQRLLGKTDDNILQARVAKSLRTRVEHETDAEGLRDYETVWTLEFRTHPPQEHSAVRKQVAADLKRIGSLNPKPDAEFQAFLIKGYKQSDATPEETTTREERLLREYPRSDEARFITLERWSKAHPQPQEQNDSAAWAKWRQDFEAAVKTWIRDFPDDYSFRASLLAYAVSNSDNLSPEEVMSAFTDEVRGAELIEYPPDYVSAAEFPLRHKVHPEKAIEVLGLAAKLLTAQHEERKIIKNRTPEEEEEHLKYEERLRLDIAHHTLEAASQLGKPDVAQSVRERVEGPSPRDVKLLSSYWANRAKLAVLENRKADALAYYQLAYQTRPGPTQWWHGKFYDELGDDSRALWKQLGGTDTAFELWVKHNQGQELAEARWEKPTKLLPEFELVDLSGKSWRLKDLRGKAVLINVWTTWCAPCRAELPHIEKLYDSLKDRSDLQLLTLNWDEDSGLVEPFLKEKGYKFPVVLAYGFLSSSFESGVPQTWIVDSQGRWQWRKWGFGGDNDWEEMVSSRLEAAKTSN